MHKVYTGFLDKSKQEQTCSTPEAIDTFIWQARGTFFLVRNLELFLSYAQTYKLMLERNVVSKKTDSGQRLISRLAFAVQEVLKPSFCSEDKLNGQIVLE